MHLKDIHGLTSVQDGHSWTFGPKKVRYWWTFVFGLLTGDLNPVHVNPFSGWDYSHRRFKGLARHGISSIADAESCVFKLFIFESPVEVVAKGYRTIKYLRPILMGDTVAYTYELLSKSVTKRKNDDGMVAEVVYRITATNQRGEAAFVSEWIICYFPTETVKVPCTLLIPVWGPTVMVTPSQALYHKLVLQPLTMVVIYAAYRLGTGQPLLPW